jgi:hypothetical protein
MDIAKHFIDEPLEKAVLSQLHITAQGEKVLLRMETEAKEGRLNHFKSKHEITRLEQDLTKWQSLLATCVDEITGRVDREKEALYWNKIHEIQKQIEELRSRQALPTGPGLPDFQMVKEFMAGLLDSWPSYASGLRNRFFKCLIDRVELRGDNEIEATIFWKAGFQQKVVIHRGNRKNDKPWTDGEANILRRLYPSSSIGDVMTALPGRSWHGIQNKARKLRLQRDRQRHPSRVYRHWTVDEERRLKTEYENGTLINVIANDLDHSPYAIQIRVAKLKLKRNKSITLQARKHYNPSSFQESSPTQGRED